MSTPSPAEVVLQNEVDRLRARVAELERERQIPSEIQRRQLAGSNEALRESEAVLRSLFDSPEVMRGIVELVDGVIVHVSCNQTAANMFGVDRAISGKSATAAGAADEVAQRWVGLYEESRRTGKPVSMEYPRRDADGRQRWLLATASYLGQGRSGNPRFAYTILYLTDHKRAEEALRESEERFRAQVTASSDVVYRMNLDWSEMRQLRGRDFIADTEAPSGTWLQKYIHPDDQPRVLAAIHKAIRTKSIFELEHRVLRVDAVKFTHENGRVWIAGASCDDAAGFCVGDTGIGIPESELQSVFDEFHQVGGPSNVAQEGTGLGLAITRRLVELHGGTIGVESTLGQGSRFIFPLGAHSLEPPC